MTCLHVVRAPAPLPVYANPDLQRKYEAACDWLQKNRTKPIPMLGLYEKMRLACEEKR